MNFDSNQSPTFNKEEAASSGVNCQVSECCFQRHINIPQHHRYCRCNVQSVYRTLQIDDVDSSCSNGTRDRCEATSNTSSSSLLFIVCRDNAASLAL
ncbi:hypothetical protein J6590_013534 [Homalodisca vitripennis]|nr:hypothetical protein J6590_013534 [Homalodisca vitripennis]